MASGATASGSGQDTRVSPSGRPDDTPADISAGTSPETADVVIGQVVRPFGRRGEVFVEPLTDDPGRFFEIGSAELGPSDLPGTRRGLESVRIHKGRPVIRFDGITDIASAESLRGMEVRIHEAERAPLPEGRYYSDQLVGCRAETEGGDRLGEIVDTLDTAGPSLLVLRGPDGSEDLIPFVEALCVSVELPTQETAGLVVLNIPDGLIGLNAPAAADAR
ncbi:MAG: ribosome maturation factor RimM [Acidobacteriota bacterium]|nr:ribosome maturation factor RimM [Acidobacteriota bacterium]